MKQTEKEYTSNEPKTATKKPCACCESTKISDKNMIKCHNCRSVWYCNEECMRKDGRFHQGKICNELREDYYAALRKN